MSVSFEDICFCISNMRNFSFNAPFHRFTNVKNVINEMVCNFGYKFSYKYKSCVWVLEKNPDFKKDYGKIYDMNGNPNINDGSFEQVRRIAFRSPFGNTFMIISDFVNTEKEDILIEDDRYLDFYISLDEKEFSGYFSKPAVFIGRILGQGFELTGHEESEKEEILNSFCDACDVSDKRIIFSWENGIIVEEELEVI